MEIRKYKAVREEIKALAEEAVEVGRTVVAIIREIKNKGF
jgi:hypothetical protein